MLLRITLHPRFWRKHEQIFSSFSFLDQGIFLHKLGEQNKNKQKFPTTSSSAYIKNLFSLLLRCEIGWLTGGGLRWCEGSCWTHTSMKKRRKIVFVCKKKENGKNLLSLHIFFLTWSRHTIYILKWNWGFSKDMSQEFEESLKVQLFIKRWEN